MNRAILYGKDKLTGILTFFCCLVISSCNNDSKSISGAGDSPTSGTINISVDESFRPVIEEHIKVYESSFPGTTIIAHYKPEADCFRDLARDTATHLIIVTRGLNEKEEQFFKDSLHFVPGWNDVASDAITIVVNARSKDSLFTIDRLKKQLTGELGKRQTIVFDGLNATSTVRYVVDSILRGQRFDTSVVKAVKNSREVLDYVASDPDAIGFVGISWIGNPEDTAQVKLLKKVKIAYVRCDTCSDSPYVKPNQFSILTNRYPLVRGLYYILRENYSGLGSGFSGFLQYERGQLIFRRAYLGPKMGFALREVRMNQKL